MKNFTFFLLLFLISYGAARAALPPQYQNMRDLNVMVEFAKQHPAVSANLKSIDLTKYTVHYGNHCKAVFGRKQRRYEVMGPAAPLEFKGSNCPVD